MACTISGYEKIDHFFEDELRVRREFIELQARFIEDQRHLFARLQYLAFKIGRAGKIRRVELYAYARAGLIGLLGDETHPAQTDVLQLADGALLVGFGHVEIAQDEVLRDAGVAPFF